MLNSTVPAKVIIYLFAMQKLCRNLSGKFLARYTTITKLSKTSYIAILEKNRYFSLIYRFLAK